MAKTGWRWAEGATTVVPANEASWDDLQSVLGARGYAAGCQCQWFQTAPAEWRSVPRPEREARLRDQTGCGDAGSGDAGSGATSGLVAYREGEPVGWCAVEPRSVYVHLLGSRVVWAGREQDPADASVWAAVCFVTRTAFRRQGVSGVLARAAVDFARDRGARALEGYPMITVPGKEITWGELHVGARNIFVDAGLAEISRPTARRSVMRIDF